MSAWDDLIAGIRANLPTRHGLDSAGEALLNLPFGAAKFAAKVAAQPVTNVKTEYHVIHSLLRGDTAGAAKAIGEWAASDGTVAKHIQQAHDAIHKDVAQPQTGRERYIDAAISAGPGGVLSQAVHDYAPDNVYRPVEELAAGIVGNMGVPLLKEGAEALKGEPKAPPKVISDEEVQASTKPAAQPEPDNSANFAKPPEVIHPEELGQPTIVADEQPSIREQSQANAQLAPQEAGPPPVIADEELGQPPVEAQAAANEALAPQEPSNVVPFPEPTNTGGVPSYTMDQRHQFSGMTDAELPPHALETTPVEAQDFDAAASTVPVDNTGYEQYTPNSEPPAAANDPTRWDAAKNFLSTLMKDERGAIPADGPEDGELKYPLAFYKLADALRRAIPARNKTEEGYNEELSKRMSEIDKVRKSTSGLEGLYAEKAQLKGELPKVEDYEAMTGLTHDEINELADYIKNHPNLRGLQSVRAREGLLKIMQGDVPTRSEIGLLARTMPPELLKQLLKEKGLWDHIKDGVISVLNTPKAIMSSYDVSAPMRQGVLMVGHKNFYTSLGPMFRAFFDTKFADDVRENMYRDDFYPVMSESGLAIPVYHNHNGGPMELGDHEEPFMTDLAGKIPGVKIGVKASERAFNTFVYKLRFDSFKTIYQQGKDAGVIWTAKNLKDLAKYINTFTGRGDLGKFQNMAPALNTMLFSPRLIKSRMDALGLTDVLPGAGKFYGDMDPFVRKQAIKSMASFVTMATTVLGLAKLAGAEVGLDPRKADGWKIKVGNTRWDIGGGVFQFTRLLTNVGEYMYDKGKEIAKTGEIKVGHNDKTAADNIGSFLRNKESPDFSFGHELLSGKTAVGENFNLKNAAIERVTPMSYGDASGIYEDLVKHGVPRDKALAKAVVMASPGLIGVSISTYDHKKKGNGGGVSLRGFGKSSFGTGSSFGKGF